MRVDNNNDMTQDPYERIFLFEFFVSAIFTFCARIIQINCVTVRQIMIKL